MPWRQVVATARQRLQRELINTGTDSCRYTCNHILTCFSNNKPLDKVIFVAALYVMGCVLSVLLTIASDLLLDYTSHQQPFPTLFSLAFLPSPLALKYLACLGLFTQVDTRLYGATWLPRL